jgi:hypothetical protein
MIFSSESIGVFPRDGGPDHAGRLLALLAFLTSTAAQELVWVFGRFRKIENRAVSGIPISFSRLDPLLPRLAELGRRGLKLLVEMEALDETSAVFCLPDLVVDGLATGTSRQRMAQELESLYGEIDASVETMLDLHEGDLSAPRRASLVTKFALGRIARDPAERAADAMMWSVGRLFGRWADSHHSLVTPELLGDELPAAPPAASQTRAFLARGILVDDEGHPDDIGALVLSCFEEKVAQVVSGSLPGEAPRLWLRAEFFDHHVRRYSAFKRKAPIYWQLAIPSSSYSVWLYIHAFSKDTLFRVQNDYVAPKLAHEERRLESLTSELRDCATAAQRKTLAAQEAVVDELRAFLDEVKRVAPLWKPNLDDGVIINFAPLWRLVPQNKSWQKELKSTWDALCEGKYDWAHLAMHFWPERVVLKCAKDRSLAIAHGLEDVFWVEGTDGKWTARKAPTRSVDELVRERTSPAVKSALKSLLEAPAAAGKSGGRGGSRRRKSAAAVEGGDA